SSDVCSSDLLNPEQVNRPHQRDAQLLIQILVQSAVDHGILEQQGPVHKQNACAGLLISLFCPPQHLFKCHILSPPRCSSSTSEWPGNIPQPRLCTTGPVSCRSSQTGICPTRGPGTHTVPAHAAVSRHTGARCSRLSPRGAAAPSLPAPASGSRQKSYPSRSPDCCTHKGPSDNPAGCA